MIRSGSGGGVCRHGDRRPWRVHSAPCVSGTSLLRLPHGRVDDRDEWTQASAAVHAASRVSLWSGTSGGDWWKKIRAGRRRMEPHSKREADRTRPAAGDLPVQGAAQTTSTRRSQGAGWIRREISGACGGWSQVGLDASASPLGRFPGGRVGGLPPLAKTRAFGTLTAITGMASWPPAALSQGLLPVFPRSPQPLEDRPENFSPISETFFRTPP